MHSGTANTRDCEEVCVWFVFLNSDLSCGGCGDAGSEGEPPPTPRPVASPGAPPPPSPNQTPEGGTPPPVAPAPTPPSTPSAYSIQLDLAGLPAADAAIFSAAADRWTSVIVGDLPGTVSTAGFRTVSNCIYPATIDDLYICGRYTNIDGPSGVLGSAGPFYTRNSDGLPVVGTMEFDSADTPSMKASGELIDTILHEMGHVIGGSWLIGLGLQGVASKSHVKPFSLPHLGIGTIWSAKGLQGSTLLGCPYRGAAANREYRAIAGCSAAPVETDGGRGTACGHWDEYCMRNELMTGFLTTGTKAILSRITIGSLEDLGYTVDYSRAEPYTRANLGSGCTCRRRTLMDMFNGETVALGLRSGNTSPAVSQHRRLSDEAHDMAMEAGRSILRQRAQAFLKGKSSTASAHLSNYTYVGDKVVSVLVQDKGEVYGVVVRMDS
jgi:Leishmanolysin